MLIEEEALLKRTYIKVNSLEEMLQFASWYAMETDFWLDSFRYPVIEKESKQYALGQNGEEKPANSLPAIFEIRKIFYHIGGGGPANGFPVIFGYDAKIICKYQWFMRHMPISLIDKHKDESFKSWEEEAILLFDWLNHTYVRINTPDEMLEFAKWYSGEKKMDSLGYPVTSDSSIKRKAFSYGMNAHHIYELPAVFKIERGVEEWLVRHRSKAALSDCSSTFGSWVNEAISLKEWLRRVK